MDLFANKNLHFLKKIIFLQEQEDDFSFGGVGDRSTQVGLVASSVDGKNDCGSPGKFYQ